MKKSILLLFIMSFFLSGISQETDDKKKKTNPFGQIVLGPTFPTVTGSDSWTFGLIGIQLGVGLNVLNFNDQLGLGAEVNFSMEGSKYDESTFEGKVMTNYLNLPVVVRYQTPGGFFAEGGVQPGILLSAKEKYNNMTVDVKDNLEGFSLGIPLGIGFQTKKKVGFGLRAVPGLSRLYKNDEDKDRNLLFLIRAHLTL